MRLTPKWLQDVRRAMDVRSWNQAELSRRAGFASESDVSRMFSQGAASTRVVSAVADTLEISDPVDQLLSEDIQDWVYAGVRMKDTDPKRFAELMVMLSNFVRDADLLDGLTDPPPEKKR